MNCFLITCTVVKPILVVKKLQVVLAAQCSQILLWSVNFFHFTLHSNSSPKSLRWLILLLYKPLLFVLVHKHAKKRTWPISSHLDRTSSVNNQYLSPYTLLTLVILDACSVECSVSSIRTQYLALLTANDIEARVDRAPAR